MRKIAFDNGGYGLPFNIQLIAGGIFGDAFHDVSMRGAKTGGVEPDHNRCFRFGQ